MCKFHHLGFLTDTILADTGERPYQCCLCQETFCRSDILKRHFNKCSIRRGNPTGAGHLTYAQAHLRPQQNNSSPLSGPPSNASVNGTPSSAISSTFRGSLHHSNPSMTSISSLSNFGPDHSHLSASAHVESRESSDTSSIRRPGSSGSDDKKRIVLNNLGGGMSSEINRVTQTAQPVPERKYQPYNFGQGQMSSHGYADSDAARWSQGTPHTQQAQPGQAQHASQQQSHQQHGTQQTHPQGQMPVGVSQEQAQSMMYGRGNFQQQYPQGHGGQMQESGAEWNNFFQASAQDNMMYTSQ